MSSKVERSDPQLWERVKRDLARRQGRQARPVVGTQSPARGSRSTSGAVAGIADASRRRPASSSGLRRNGVRSPGAKPGSGERYLPKRAREALSDEEYRATSDKKRRDLQRGRQHSRQPRRIAEKTARYRDGGTGERREPTKADLYEEARRRDLPGRSRMSKAELAHALKRMIKGDENVTYSEQQEIHTAFRQAVNMAPKELERWLDRRRASRSVGRGRGEDEAVGHKSGRRIVELKRKKMAELSDDHYAHMQKVVGYVHRHKAQRPKGDVTETRWRFSLMNWGHDPLKDS